MSDKSGYKWWIQFVVVPLVGSGTMLSLVTYLMSDGQKVVPVQEVPGELRVIFAQQNASFTSIDDRHVRINFEADLNFFNDGPEALVQRLSLVVPESSNYSDDRALQECWNAPGGDFFEEKDIDAFSVQNGERVVRHVALQTRPVDIEYNGTWSDTQHLPLCFSFIILDANGTKVCPMVPTAWVSNDGQMWPQDEFKLLPHGECDF